ncbi:hypothetical protein FHW88_003352 [Mucilaginibacter sp. SG538B]|uniref:hypothetical protein n=1 Tax=Mucilaginibacter sp. SG538B TaxID=2587021 RepID=UPI00159D89F7|nr:hypothetical protein [Mucilaginibacter sp. SG538B]NVM65048.1 hypothetical protein [Mucilaginibacter sp. SG538B]
MGLLETDHAETIIAKVETAKANGAQYIVLETRPMDAQLHANDIKIFTTLDDALDYLDEKEDLGHVPGFGNDEHPLYYQRIDNFLADIRTANPAATLSLAIDKGIINDNQSNNKAMNLNNLQDLKKEVAALGFSPKTAEELEKNMRQLPQHFTVKDHLPGDRGQVDLTLHFHKSGVSDIYSFGKFEATAGKVPPSAPNQSYMVLSENKDNKEKPLVKSFDSPNEAIEFFKKHKGTSELSIGESPESRLLLASKENGKVNFVHDDFRGAYFSPAIKQTFYVKEGAGYSATQAANMVQGRTVHRDDLINPRNGEGYKAWIKLDFEQKKDDWGNFKLKQMNDPAFGFDLEKTLKGFKIKELSDPAQKEGIMSAMKNGDRVAVTATNREGKEVSLMAEAAPQYKTLDFYSEKGTREKRELYKQPEKTQSESKSQAKDKEKELDESRSVKI